MNYQLSLRITHPSIDPLEITRTLSLDHSVCHKQGEERRTPKGNPLPGQNKNSFWLHEVVVDDHEDISSAIEHTNHKLKDHQEFLTNLVKEGGNIQYFIGWFVEANSGDILDWELLRHCAELNIDLYFDIYAK
ncbi:MULTISPECIES: DUF4279 domain-containing protein [unclassified Lysobacter]|uniref:DUF4279 domain-containing protein n=1 Tax=unclassified Lysobacter TaxID=2635362 RepID=UPI001BEA16DF|nr:MULTISPECIES: DUF4279 domain-containing protein [unclassified Lysobacter]MBT2750085.1 DUF4279 domain-containing protein [Lysobacter sp. ISL-50]MBT2775343.1 DUF4279 domain-containing protein [Lysobacter sp. ISL-54]MBT2783466.1 DUF4279 domain-containing protein [Lysobacter sp. ISL-52]